MYAVDDKNGFTHTLGFASFAKRAKSAKQNLVCGFTLFEVLVYIGLFSMIMTGALVGAYHVIDSSVDTRERIILEQEAHFIFRKIDWAMNGDITGVSIITDGFQIEKAGDDLDFRLNGGVLTLDMDDGSGPQPLSSSAVTVSSLSADVVSAPPAPDALEVSFVLNDRQFATTTRYIR